MDVVPASQDDIDTLTITPLGAGQEVGRSCIVLRYKGITVMLDCGLHPGLSGRQAYPYTDLVDTSEIDVLLISHFHLDHCGALPWFLKELNFRGKIYMTHATKAIYRWMMADYIRVSNIQEQEGAGGFTEKDVDASMDAIETIDFHQEVVVAGMKFTAYGAGHVLGAAMFMMEIAGVKILYTGDYSREEDRHLTAAEAPEIKPDVLITESTFGVHVHDDRVKREARFTSTVHEIVSRGGRCLIPVFAIGRAQELLLILDDYWHRHPDLHDIPIYYASALARRCLAVFQTFVNMMNSRIKQQIRVRNPFQFRYISNLKSLGHFDELGDNGPSVVLASPGMLQSGLSRDLFERWAGDRRNGVIIAGYCVNGTLAKDLLTDPQDFVSTSGARLPRRMEISYISFAAHVDYEQNKSFITDCEPSHVVLVHGEKNEMLKFKEAMMREFEELDNVVTFHSPENAASVSLYFRGEKVAKVVGTIAKEPAREDKALSGLLVKRGFNYLIVDPADIPEYTQLQTSSVSQKQVMTFRYSLSLLHYHLMQVHGPEAAKRDITDEGPHVLKVMDRITIGLDESSNTLELMWQASPENDMWADAVVAVVLQIESSPSVIRVASSFPKRLPEAQHLSDEEFLTHLARSLENQFGEVEVATDKKTLKLKVDKHEAVIDLRNLEVTSNNAKLKQLVYSSCRRVHLALRPHVALGGASSS